MTNPILETAPPPPVVAPFFDKGSNTFSYVVSDPATKCCAVIDSVLNFDYASGAISHEGADAIIAYIKMHSLNTEWLIETHVHADHLSAAPYIQSSVGGTLAIGKQITVVQETFAAVYNEGKGFCRDGSQFDHLFKDGEKYTIGNLQATALHTPGHTPACFTHVIGNAAFIGDTMFMPDAGTARADFPGGDAAVLFRSIQRILELPSDTRLFMCHDYGPDGREIEYQTTVAEQSAQNIHINQLVDEADFVALREARDATLGMPQLILPSLQVNMRAGHLPEPENNNTVYLKIPINAF